MEIRHALHRGRTARAGSKGAALAVLATAQLVIGLDYSIVNVALPDIGRSLGFTDGTVQWVISAKTMTFGGFLLLGGREPPDLLGRRRMSMAALSLFGLASLAGGLAQHAGLLIAARAAQGIGGAVLFPSTLSLVNTTYEEGRERNRAIAVWGSAGAGGLSLGVLAGGVLTGLREGLASLLERSGFEVVGQAGDAAGLLALAREHHPELLIVDIRMPPTYSTEGLEAARVIRGELPEAGILLLSAHVVVEHATELLAGGRGVGYVLKRRVTDVDEFVDTLERISRGGSVVDPALVQELVAARRRDDPLAVLTAREREVLGLMAEGRSNAGIARRLWVTEGTVEKHVRSIMAKLALPETDDDHRRVLTVIAYLETR